jgi:formylglycine-generating enzyme
VTSSRETGTVPGRPPAKDMVWIPGGEFLMGSDDFYPEEAPARRVALDGFWMDTHPVTVSQFRRFVRSTGHVTVAERSPDPAEFPDADPALLVPASWRHPEGPDSNLNGRDRHPVTHVAHEDAEAYALWAGKELATEAEWEFAARGGLERAVYVWGDEFAPRGRMMANTWQGEFPWQNLGTDRYEGTSPVRSFRPNGFGLFDMAGNVWEWTSDYFAVNGTDEAEHACCAPRNPRVTSPEASLVPGQPGANVPRRVIKGGSHLCAPNYCLRYRPAARQSETVDTSTGHIGFRCIVRVRP